MSNSTSTVTAFQKLDRTGAVHLGEVRQGGNAFTFCNGRHLSWSFPTDAKVTCKACVKKAASLGVEA